MLLDEVAVERVPQDRAEDVSEDVLRRLFDREKAGCQSSEELLHFCCCILDLQLVDVLQDERGVHLPVLE